MSFHPVPRPTARARVSVVVPCYRYGHYLDAVIRSIVAQPNVDTEIIVVDDASPDDSGDVVRQLAAHYPNVTGVVHEQNLGHIATYNDGLGRATGEYVLLLSADDLLTPGALSRATAIMQRFPRVGLVYGFAPSFLDIPPPPRSQWPHITVWRGTDWITRVCRRGQNPVSTPTAVMRRDLLDTVGGYDAALPHTADLLMWLRAAAQADVGYVNGVDQAHYRVHGSNMHMTTFAQLTSDLEERHQAFQTFAAEAYPGSAGAVQLARADRALRQEAERAGRRLDHSSADSGPAAEALRAFRARHAEAARGQSRAGRSRDELKALPSTLLGYWAALGDRVEWRYWRRFGLRL